MHDAVYARAVSALTKLGPLRVWSLLVTVFGEFGSDTLLSGPVLSNIMTEIGIKPEATRVALHRLRSDKWITSQKSGRTSLYRLTEKGRADTEAARPRIYGSSPKGCHDLQVIVTRDGGNELDPSEFARIAPRVFVAGAHANPPADALSLTPLDLPPWLGSQIESPAMRDAYAALYDVLSDIEPDLPTGVRCSPIQATVLRILIVHTWRRLVLKHPELPRAAHSDTWRGEECRHLVTAILKRLPKPAPDELLKA